MSYPFSRTDELQNSLAGYEQFIADLEQMILSGNGDSTDHQKCIDMSQVKINEINTELNRRSVTGCRHA